MRQASDKTWNNFSSLEHVFRWFEEIIWNLERVFAEARCTTYQVLDILNRDGDDEVQKEIERNASYYL